MPVSYHCTVDAQVAPGWEELHTVEARACRDVLQHIRFVLQPTLALDRLAGALDDLPGDVVARVKLLIADCRARCVAFCDATGVALVRPADPLWDPLGCA